MCTPSSQWPFFGLFERDGVVEIAGVDRVDRDDRLGRQVAAALADRLVELLGLGAGIVERIVVEFARQIELVDDRHRVDARLAAPAQNVDDHAFAVAAVGSGSGPCR